jgi:hypothetical protein
VQPRGEEGGSASESHTPLLIVVFVKFGSIDNNSPMRGHVGHPEASQGDLENQLVL